MNNPQEEWHRQVNEELHRCLQDNNPPGFLARIHLSDCRDLIRQDIQRARPELSIEEVAKVYEKAFIFLDKQLRKSPVVFFGENPFGDVLLATYVRAKLYKANRENGESQGFAL